MKRTFSQLLIAFFSAAGVVLVAVVDSSKPMPGGLTAVHEMVPELSGGQDCTLCHGGVFNSMAEACLECHDFVGDQAEDLQGLHGSLGNERLGQCSLCHSEHHGPQFQMVNRQSFAQAGTAGPEDFDHAVVGYEQLGKHVDLGCVECHVNAEKAVLSEGDRRFAGLDQSCASCHEDPHEGQLSNDCTSCHSQGGFEERHFEGHEQWLPLLGAHASVDCRECHGEGESHALERVLRGNSPQRECIACHETPHGEAFVRAEALSTGRTEGASCRSCHQSMHESFRSEDLQLSAAQHATTGFALAAPHQEAGCDDCHAPERDEFSARYPGRKPNDCASCHEHPHGDQFERGPSGATQCLDCHNAQHFDPHEFTEQVHNTRAMKLDQSHAQLECAQCHLDPSEGQARVLRGTSTECAACHEDSHRGFFDARAFVDGSNTVGDCDDCHTPATFSEVPEHKFEHGQRTGFEVRGSHAQNGCESCHIPTPEPDDTGRRFGRVNDHFGVAGGCAKCHEDPHQGRFSASNLPREAQGRTGCARCHDEVSFRTQPHGFDHALWSEFELAGAHAEARCTSCHETLRRPDEHGRTWQAAAGKNCADCHVDPHAGQFAERDVVGQFVRCDRCHSESAGFDAPHFDHNTDSEFPLEDHHAALDCAACHKKVPGEDASVVRYKPLGMECVDCHGVQERTLLRRKRRRP